MNTLDHQFIERIEKLAIQMGTEMPSRLIGMLVGDDGLTYGDIPLRGPAERALFVQDLRDRGVWEYFVFIDQAVGSNHAGKLEAQVQRDRAQLIGIR